MTEKCTKSISLWEIMGINKEYGGWVTQTGVAGEYHYAPNTVVKYVKSVHLILKHLTF